MSAIQRRVERLESATGADGYSHEKALQELNRRDEEHRAFCASATEAESIAKLHAIDADEAESVAELADPSPPPPEGTAARFFFDVRHSYSPEREREFWDQHERATVVAALAGRIGVTIPPKPTPSHGEALWPANWAKDVIREARGHLGEGAPVADAIENVLRKCLQGGAFAVGAR